jgi:hypothetical protein
MLVLLWFRDVGSGWTYGPELFDDVELNIVLGNLLEDNKVVLGLVEGREGGRVSATKKIDVRRGCSKHWRVRMAISGRLLTAHPW